jgi:chromosomal replication initiator protein
MNDQYTLDDSDELIRLRQAWNHVTKRASGDIPSQSFERFIRPLKPIALGDDSAQIAAPGKFVHEWVSARCLSMLESYLSDEIGRTVRIELTWEAREKPTTKTPVAVAAPVVETSQFRPNDRYTFDSFVVGQSNRMAHAGAKAVAAQPGARYNPLFICGPSGLGKTHLLHAIAREVMATSPKYQIAYITAQQFAEEFVGALQNNRVENFRRAQRNVGLWLIDDIQFIAGKDKTQEEVFHTFNHLYSLNKQIVICADRAPRELQLMDERLRSRFESGLVADIQMPDTETRCAIIQSKAAHDNLELAHDVAFYLAENVPGNIRQLEGVLTRLAVQASLEEKPLLMELAQAMVEKYYRGTLEKPDVMEIIAAVSSQFGISKEDIKGVSRKAPIVEARHIAIFITREIRGDSWKHIGTLFGNRDHTSMMHGYQKVQEMMMHDKNLKTVVKSMIRNLYPNL